MIVYPLILLEGVLAVVGQMLFPLSSIWVDVEPRLPILVVLSLVFYLEGWESLLLALAVGMGVDLLSPQRLGSSSLAFALAVGLIVTQRRGAASARLDFQALMILVGTYFYLMVDYLLVSAQLHRWYWPAGLWPRMLYPALFNMALGIVALLFNRWLLRRFSHSPGRTFEDDYD